MTYLERLAREHQDAQPAEGPQWGPPVIEAGEPILSEFLRSMLVWESTSAKAEAALGRVESAVVDFNELRVCLPTELVAMLGQEYPLARERADRLRAALAELYTREHRVTLEHLAELGKREALLYLESLNGVPHYAASRVALVCLGNHAMPVDSGVLRVLAEAHVVAPGETQEGASAAIEHRVRGGEMLGVYRRLRAKADALGPIEAASTLGSVSIVVKSASSHRTKRAGRGARAGGAR